MIIMSDILIGSAGGAVSGIIIGLGIFIFKEYIKNFFAQDILEKQEEYKKQNEKLRKVFETKLAEINAELTNYNTRYSYLKKEEIEVYRTIYSKLLRVVYSIKNYFDESKKDYSQLDEGIIKEILNEWECPNNIKEELFSIDKVEMPNKFNNKFIEIRKTHIFNRILKSKREFNEYFLDNELFISDNISEKIEEIIDRINLFVEIVNCMEKKIGFIIMKLYFKGVNLKDAKSIDEEFYKLKKSVDNLKNMLKKEINEH